MANPFDPAYLLTASRELGPFAWLFFILQVGIVAGGLYLMYLQQDNNAVRRALMRQIGTGLLIAGGAGVLLGVLRLLDVPVFNQRYWLYVQLLVELALGGYLLYVLRSVLPQRLARAQAARGKGGAQRVAARPLSAQPPPQNGTARPSEPRPVATTGRREARRERKRRGR